MQKKQPIQFLKLQKSCLQFSICFQTSQVWLICRKYQIENNQFQTRFLPLYYLFQKQLDFIIFSLIQQQMNWLIQSLAVFYLIFQQTFLESFLKCRLIKPIQRNPKKTKQSFYYYNSNQVLVYTGMVTFQKNMVNKGFIQLKGTNYRTIPVYIIVIDCKLFCQRKGSVHFQ